jgi:hypothetical protein
LQILFQPELEDWAAEDNIQFVVRNNLHFLMVKQVLNVVGVVVIEEQRQKSFINKF